MGAQSLYKPKSFFGEKGVEATASDNLSSRLPYMFAVSRFAHYLKVLVRNKIGRNQREGAVDKAAAVVDIISMSTATR